ncbi:hypothetical protein FAIPA1_170009 [Frankia sp. AiPs1]
MADSRLLVAQGAPAITVSSKHHDRRAPLPTADPPPPSSPPRVTTDRPRKTFVALLPGYEGTNRTENR